MSAILCNLATPEQAYKLSSSLPIWFDPHWMHAISELHQVTPQVLIAFKKDNPVAWLPLYVKELLTIKKAYNPVLVYYSPLHFDIPGRVLSNREMMLEYEISQVMGEYLNKTYKRVMLNSAPELYDIRGFRDAGLSAVPQYTFIKDLSTGFKIHKNEMTTLRKAEKHGFVFDGDFEPEDLLELVYQMYSRKNHPFPIKRNKLANVLTELHRNGIIAQYNLRDAQKIVSSIMIIKGRGEACYAWLSATETEAMKQGASILMFRELFSELQKGFRYVDLCGANSVGPSRLKAAIGAELRLFFQIIK